MVESTVENPTIDCKTCGFDDVDEKEEFRCKWRYPKPIEIVDGNRCKSVVMINEIYEEAVANKKLKGEVQW